MRNFIEDKPCGTVKVGEYETGVYRVHMNSFDLVYLFTSFQKDRMCWQDFIYFKLDHMLVSEEYKQEFEEYCRLVQVSVYTERQIKMLTRS